MQRSRLTATAQAQRAQLVKTTDDRHLRDRCQAALLASRGRKRKRLAQDGGAPRTTGRRWRRHSQAPGVAG